MGPNQEACRPKTLTLFAPHTDLFKKPEQELKMLKINFGGKMKSSSNAFAVC